MQTEHEVVKKIQVLDLRNIIEEHLTSKGYKVSEFCGAIEFYYSDKRISVGYVHCVIQDPNNPPKIKVEIKSQQAKEIIAKHMGVKTDTHEIEIH